MNQVIRADTAKKTQVALVSGALKNVLVSGIDELKGVRGLRAIYERQMRTYGRMAAERMSLGDLEGAGIAAERQIKAMNELVLFNMPDEERIALYGKIAEAQDRVGRLLERMAQRLGRQGKPAEAAITWGLKGEAHRGEVETYLLASYSLVHSKSKDEIKSTVLKMAGALLKSSRAHLRAVAAYYKIYRKLSDENPQAIDERKRLLCLCSGEATASKGVLVGVLYKALEQYCENDDLCRQAYINIEEFSKRLGKMEDKELASFLIIIGKRAYTLHLNGKNGIGEMNRIIAEIERD